MRFCITGASGFLGTALTGHLTRNGHQVVRLVRREPRGGDESPWDPARGIVDDTVLERSDVVVNLAGAAFVHWPWTADYKRLLLQSRVDSTRTVARAIARSQRKPALISGSGVNAYGDDRGDEALHEESRRGTGFLADVVEEWEAATEVASDAGARVCQIRTSAALHSSGGPLKPMLIPFRLGLGGRIGSGQQYFSALSRRDWLRAVEFLAVHEHAEGPYNLAAPDPPTNAEFTTALAAAVGRPAFMRAPIPLLRAVAGELASLLVGSLRVQPRRLLEAGFEFEHPDLESMLEHALRR